MSNFYVVPVYCLLCEDFYNTRVYHAKRADFAVCPYCQSPVVINSVPYSVSMN